MRRKDKRGLRYKDKRGFLFEVRHGHYGWTTYCYNPKKDIWWPWPCENWYLSEEEAAVSLMRYADKRGWVKVCLTI